jgi:hypothetical protein
VAAPASMDRVTMESRFLRWPLAEREDISPKSLTTILYRATVRRKVWTIPSHLRGWAMPDQITVRFPIIGRGVATGRSAQMTIHGAFSSADAQPPPSRDGCLCPALLGGFAWLTP